jgi:DNA-binding SARP family transcriptional activator
MLLGVEVLGPTAVTTADGARPDLGARRHSEVLALLAAHAGRTVPAEALADMLWRGEPPGTASTTLQG